MHNTTQHTAQNAQNTQTAQTTQGAQNVRTAPTPKNVPAINPAQPSQRPDLSPGALRRSLLALASGAFILGAAEFVMMGILPQAAAATHVSIPVAGHYISSYAFGVCAGTIMLICGRRVPPRNLIIAFMAIAVVGNLGSALSTGRVMLLISRFVSGLPHGAFFGTATLVARTVAPRGKEARSVSMMVTGQTVANMLGVPAGTLLAETMS